MVGTGGVCGFWEGQASKFQRKTSDVSVRSHALEEGGKEGVADGLLNMEEGVGTAFVGSLEKLPLILERFVHGTKGRLGVGLTNRRE